MRIAFLRQFHSNLWFSGAQIQALQMAEALRNLGVTVEFVGADCRAESYDVLHVFGLYAEYLPIIHQYRRRGVSVVVSPIFFKDVSTLLKRVLAAAAPGWGSFSRVYRIQREILRNADALLPNTQAEAQFVGRYFRLRCPMIVVPNGVDPRFAAGEPRLFRQTFGIEGDFVLNIGRIERRKNQWRLIQALRGTGLPLVVIGECISRKYGLRCQQVRGAEVQFLPALPHDSPLLASAYAACRVFALPSLLETPGLAALEAGVAGARIVVTPYGGAPEYFQAFARYPNPRSVKAIRAAILEAWDAPHDAEAQSQFLLSRYTWNAVAQQACQAYHQVIGRLHADCGM
ncbi:MAG: glycosyltransferase [Armatimonadetes bacterium JP3_11]|jgi:glycosyltransferase involved in cell wall biosynthesis|nr:MAG: glycosyltransferase [Armatimonadetes bacterium JP3_11]RMH10146.1 MAG: glycosyltransferase [Armatimonadota bacterium]